MSNRHRFIIGALLAANLIIGGFVFASRYSSEVASDPAHGSLPSLEMHDDLGRTLDTKEFIGSPLFVQFINPHIDAQVASFILARKNRPGRPLSWLLVTKDARELRKHLPKDSHDVAIVESQYEHLRELFNVPKCCERWLIFDESGKLKNSGDYDSGDVVSALRSVADGEPPYSEAVLWNSINSLDRRDSAQILDSSSHSTSHKAVVVLLSSVCTGCGNGALVDALNIYAGELSPISFLAIVPDSFSQADVKNLKANLNLFFPVEVASSRLSQQWSLLNERYGEMKTNGALILVSEGKIVSVVNGVERAGEVKRILKEFAK